MYRFTDEELQSAYESHALYDRELTYRVSVGSFDMDDYRLQSLDIDRINQTDTNIIGNAIPQTCILTIGGIPQGYDFKDGEVRVEVGIKLNGYYRYIPFTPFKVFTQMYNEQNKTYTLTCYDALYGANEPSFSELDIIYPITYKNLLKSICERMGWVLGTQTFFHSDIELTSSPNFNGWESLLSVLRSLCEATLTNAYIDRVYSDGKPVLILKDVIQTESVFDVGSKYVNLVTSSTFGEVNSLVLSRDAQEDNFVYPADVEDRVDFVIKDNPFIDYGTGDNRPDLAPSIFDHIEGFSVTAYALSYKGNIQLDPYDLITIERTDGTSFTTLYVGDKISCNSGLNAETTLNAVSQSEIDHQRATSLADMVKLTYLKVDKVEQTITSVVQDVDNLGVKYTQVQQTTDNIEIQIANGLDKLTNELVRIDSNGLTISNSESDVNTNIDADGLTISNKSGETIATFKNNGVNTPRLRSDKLIVGGLLIKLSSDGTMGDAYWVGGAL